VEYPGVTALTQHASTLAEDGGKMSLGGAPIALERVSEVLGIDL
jgi:hypothetical protein